MVKVNVLLAMAGEASHWNNHLGTDKHFVKILGEPVVERAVRLLNKYKPSEVEELSITAVVKDNADSKYDTLKDMGVFVENGGNV